MTDLPGNKQCSKCGEVKPANRDYFGSTPKGNLRNVCRICINKNSRSYAKENPDSVRLRANNRHQQSDRFKPTDALKTQLAVDQKGCCALCCKQIDRDDLFDATEVQVEHLTPVSRGGTNDDSNLVIACRTCNQEKAGKTMREYWIWRDKVGLPKIPFLMDKVIAAISRDE
jgi:5-methylcytosine-specific restriction endonuclease McrA